MSIFLNSLKSTGSFTFTRHIKSCTTKYCDSGSLKYTDLKALFSKKIDCLVVEGFLRGKALEDSQRLFASYHAGLIEFPASRVYSGFACEDVITKPALAPWYDKVAVKSLSKLREDSESTFTFVDKLRLELDEEVPSGAMIEIHEGKKRGSYIARAYGSERKSLVEIRDIPHPFKPSDLKAHFIALQFLVAPCKGGALELFPGLLDETEKKALSEKRLEIIPSTLPKAAEIIKPYAGRLVLINADIPFKYQQVEAIELPGKNPEKDPPIKKDISLAMIESYLVYKGDSKPLTILR
jgi:hypothetical protein